jgi:hypothetical protein
MGSALGSLWDQALSSAQARAKHSSLALAFNVALKNLERLSIWQSRLTPTSVRRCYYTGHQECKLPPWIRRYVERKVTASRL